MKPSPIFDKLVRGEWKKREGRRDHATRELQCQGPETWRPGKKNAAVLCGYRGHGR